MYVAFVDRTNMEDLRETTHYEHYELFRKNRLQEMGFADSTADNRPVRLYDVIEKKRIEHMKEMETKEEQMRQMFVDKVKQKEAELKKAEQDVSSFVVVHACCLWSKAGNSRSDQGWRMWGPGSGNKRLVCLGCLSINVCVFCFRARKIGHQVVI